MENNFIKTRKSIFCAVALSTFVFSALSFNSSEFRVNGEVKMIEGNKQSNSQKSNTLESYDYERVVAGTVNIAQMLDKLEFTGVVGVPDTSYELPKKFQDKQKIGQPMKPNAEVVKSLNPDLFLTTTSLKGKLEEQFKNINIKTEYLDLDSITSIKSSYMLMGKMFGKEEKANEIIKEIDGKIIEIKNKSKNKKKVKVLLLFGSPKSIMIATKNSYVGSIMEELNIDNVANEIIKESKDNYVPINSELLLTTKADVILRISHAKPEETKKMFEKEFSTNDIWKNMEAVKNDKVIDLDNELFSVSGGPRVVETIEKLYEYIHGKE